MKKGLLSAGLLLAASFAFAAINSFDRVSANGTAESTDEGLGQTATFSLDISKFKRGDNPAQYLGFFRMSMQSAQRNFTMRMNRASDLEITDIEEGGKKITIQGQAMLTKGSYFNRQQVSGNVTIVITDNSGDSGDTIQISFSQSGFPGLQNNNSFTFDGNVISGQLRLVQRVWES